MTADQIVAFLDEHFPQARAGFPHAIESIGDGRLRMSATFGDASARPGGTLAGPALMAMADTAMYLLLLSMRGPMPLAFTTSLDIHFLRRPRLGTLHADAEMLKLGKRLAVGLVLLRNADDPAPVAQATVTYSLPPAD
jgi:uncharacterized protein (TIGR00369 family)